MSRIPVYIWRDPRFSPGGASVASAAPLDCVTAVFGGGGLKGEGGVSVAFGGATFFRNEETEECYVGVWGARKASRFRARLNTAFALEICRQPPPARRIFWSGGNTKPQSRRKPGPMVQIMSR